MNTKSPKAPNWKDYIQREDVLRMWTECWQEDLTHTDLADHIHSFIKERKPNYTLGAPNPQSLKEVCTQIKAGLERQVDKALEDAPTEKYKNMILKAKARIPELLRGASSGQRADYKSMFNNLFAGVERDETKSSSNQLPLGPDED
tara:strand:+ start:266 stop:703 length:438 start_codon:yes stop_codon:yes gene_type:complete